MARLKTWNWMMVMIAQTISANTWQVEGTSSLHADFDTQQRLAQ
jgi:hypothetical protein